MNWWKRLMTLLVEVRTELKKTSWPGWQEVRGTTVVVILASFIFAFFLWGVDVVVQQVVKRVVELFSA